MPRLFVANLSKQHHEFHYPRPERRSAVITIPIGQQREIGDLPDNEIALIVDHHARYGLVNVNEIKNRRDFTGLCYRIGHAVPIDTFHESYEKNDEALDERSAEIRQEAATAMTHKMEETLGTPIHRTEVEIIEETRGTPRIAEGVEVVGEGAVARHEPQRSAPRKR